MCGFHICFHCCWLEPKIEITQIESGDGRNEDPAIENTILFHYHCPRWCIFRKNALMDLSYGTLTAAKTPPNRMVDNEKHAGHKLRNLYRLFVSHTKHNDRQTYGSPHPTINYAIISNFNNKIVL